MSDKTKRCQLRECGEPFTPTRSWQQYHSKKCGNKARQRRLLKRAKVGLKLERSMG
jgi:hypothetical protein